MSGTESCGNCRFAHRVEIMQIHAHRLVCRRFPPSLRQRLGDGFPNTSSHEWCGEWVSGDDR